MYGKSYCIQVAPFNKDNFITGVPKTKGLHGVQSNNEIFNPINTMIGLTNKVSKQKFLGLILDKY